jgi:hypothetical protein
VTPCGFFNGISAGKILYDGFSPAIGWHIMRGQASGSENLLPRKEVVCSCGVGTPLAEHYRAVFG